MKKLTSILSMIITLSAWATPSMPGANIDSQIELQRRFNNISIQEDDLKALEELNDSLGRLDSWLDRRVKAIEEEKRRQEKEHALIMEYINNVERYECEDVSYLPELEEECLDDYYIDEGDSCYYQEFNSSLSR